MSGFFKICGAALLAVCAGLFLKDRHRDLSSVIAVCAGVAILSATVGCAEQITEFIKDVSEGSAASSYVPVLLKAVGFSVLTEISVGICRSAGEEGLAGAVGFAGRCEILLLALPYVRELVGVALGMLER
ncbi:MAG: hypothetical protein IKI03_07890 [Clostridia bacterium]|nr:hypothetical protein [Clostridia bacterium]